MYLSNSVMFVGSIQFGGMLHSCRRAGMCMLAFSSENSKLIKLIKQALAYGKKRLILKHFQKQVVRLARSLSKEKQAYILRFVGVFFNIKQVFFCIICFVSLIYGMVLTTISI